MVTLRCHYWFCILSTPHKMHFSTACFFQVVLLREALETHRTLKRLLFGALATVVQCIAFLVCRRGTYGINVDLGSTATMSPHVYITLNIGEGLQTIWEGSYSSYVCHLVLPITTMHPQQRGRVSIEINNIWSQNHIL